MCTCFLIETLILLILTKWVIFNFPIVFASKNNYRKIELTDKTRFHPNRLWLFNLYFVIPNIVLEPLILNMYISIILLR